jgi:glucan biosynthesis protein C
MGETTPSPPAGPVRPRFHHRRRLLIVGMAAPIVALSAVLAALAAYPGFNHARQYLSELGGSASHAPYIFNDGVFAAGLMAALAGLGFGLAITALTGARVAAILTAFVFCVAGAGLMISGVYTWPDPRHLAVNLGLGIQLGPLFLLWGLWTRKDARRLKIFLVVVFVIMAVLTVLTKHLVWPSLVNDDNVGWWERSYAVVLVGWVGVAAFVLERRLETEARQGFADSATKSSKKITSA